MQITYPRILNKKNYIRFLNRCLRENREFKCSRCGRPFKMGDYIFKFRAKHDYYCIECYEQLYSDIPDDILNENEKLFIESGDSKYLD